MAGEVGLIGQFAVAAVYLGLATWLVVLNFSGRLFRSLALILALRGATVLVNQVVLLDPTNAQLWHNFRTYLFLATPFAILDFAILYTWRQSTPPRRAARRFLLATLIAFEFAFLVDHTLVWTLGSTGIRYGSLGFMATAFTAVLALAALWFAYLARQVLVPAQARFHRLMGLGFLTAALADASGTFHFMLRIGLPNLLERTGTDGGAVAAQSVALAAVPLAFAAAAMLVTESLSSGHRSRALWQGSIAIFVFLFPLIARVTSAGEEAHASAFFSALPRAVAALLIAYALVRQVASTIDVFQLDLRTGLALQRGTVGGILVAFFFVVSESAANIIADSASNLSPMVAQMIGIVGAGILLVFLQPLNRLGERLAGDVLPHARPISDLRSGDRVAIYKEQVELAWADGSITRKERLLLDKLRDQLALPIAEAVRLESRAAKGAAGPG